MTRKDRILFLIQDGYTYTEAAAIIGVSRQYVTLVVHKSGVEKCDFRRMTEEHCIYPAFAKWWNDNRMTYHKFFEAMGFCYHYDNITRLARYLKGNGEPKKSYIDKMLAATGLPYETLFCKEGG